MKSPARRTRLRRSGYVFLRKSSNGFTIMELLVASAVAMLMVAGLVTAFRVIGDQIAIARATLELSGQLRSGTHRLREDLKHVSAPVRPWLRPSDGLGYFEYIEGAGSDLKQPNTDDSIGGDIDDILMFTARTEGEPFVGRFLGDMITSREAEIIYWAEDENQDGKWSPGEQVTLHRRVLLVRPDLTRPPNRTVLIPLMSITDFYANNDVSVSLREVYVDNPDPMVSGLVLEERLIANSLADLTKRENRFAHGSISGRNLPDGFPFAVSTTNLGALVQSGTSHGNDVLLSNILAFDIKAYDPLVRVRDDDPDPAVVGANALLPHDNGYDSVGNAFGNVVGNGGYVDLNYRSYAPSVPLSTSDFSDQPNPRSGLRTTPPIPAALNPIRTYCTWSTHYESDGENQDFLLPAPYNDNLIDEGTDGIDNDPPSTGPGDPLDGVVDDLNERETSPPYPVPLRGIQVTIRVFEPDSQRVRQMSAIQDFVPE